MKKIIALLLASAVLLAAAGCSSSPKIESSYDNAKAYISYLEKVKGNEDDIEGYIDESTGEYLVDIQNTSEYFWQGQIIVMDADNKKIGNYSTTLVRPYGYYFSFDKIDGTPDTFLNEKNQFYKFTYPTVDFDYESIYDITSDGESEWYNIMLEQQCTKENAITVAKYEYAVNVITDDYYSNYFFFNDVYETYYDEEYEEDYPDTASAKFGASVDFEAKTITIMENQNGNWVELETITME